MKLRKPSKNFIYLLVIVAVGAVILLMVSRLTAPQGENMPLSEIASMINSGQVKSISVTGDDVTVVDVSGAVTTSYKESSSDLFTQLEKLGAKVDPKVVKVTVDRPPEWGTLLSTLSFLLPGLIVVGLIYFMFRQAQGTNNQAILFGRSHARMFTGEHPTVTFEDVAGVDEAKHELAEVVDFLKEPEKYVALGARIPKGVLLVGPPGTGKTLMGKAVSGEAGVPFFIISGSEFIEMFVGVGASRVRDLFDQAKRHSPCIVFIDEIDAVGRHRGAGLGGSHDEREQTLNQILVEMDGFDTDTNVIIMAATNRPDILDPALLRPGRFDRRIVLDKPDVLGREEILKVHVRGRPLASNVDLSVLSKATPGLSGADLENMVNEAAILAVQRNKKSIGQPELEESVARVISGAERKSRLITDEEKRIIAYHEAGHVVVAKVLPSCSDKVRKVSIIGRGTSSGYMLALPEGDRLINSRAKFKDDLAFNLGGYVAEEIVFGDITTIADDDLQRVSELAKTMVTRYGMSKKLGPMAYRQRENIFLGKELSEQRDYSDIVAAKIDDEIQLLTSEAHTTAKQILTDNRDKLDSIAQRLIEVETLDEPQLVAFFR